MTHGYCKVTSSGVVLGYVPDAPVFRFLPGPVLPLVPAALNENIVGFVLRPISSTRGLLYYPTMKELALAVEVRDALNSVPYFERRTITPLTVGLECSGGAAFPSCASSRLGGQGTSGG